MARAAALSCRLDASLPLPLGAARGEGEGGGGDGAVGWPALCSLACVSAPLAAHSTREMRGRRAETNLGGRAAGGDGANGRRQAGTAALFSAAVLIGSTAPGCFQGQGGV